MFNRFPNTDFNEVNLDWILKKISGIGNFESEIERAANEANRATNEADRATSEADRATSEADRATSEADASAVSASTAKTEADRAGAFAEVVELNNRKISLLWESICNSSGAITRLMHVAGTYLNKQVFVYGNWNGAFNRTCVQNAEGLWEIDCVTFVQLCLMGCDFEHSRYNGNAENVGSGGIQLYPSGDYVTVSRPYGFLSGQLARYADNHGWLYTPLSASDIKVGDVVFCHTSEQESSWQGSGITHCALVVDTYSDSVTVAEAFNYAEQDYHNIIRLASRRIDSDNIIKAARFPLADQKINTVNLLHNELNTESKFTTPVDVSLTGGNITQLRPFYVDPAKLEIEKPYTFYINCPQSKADWEWFLYFNGIIVASNNKRSPQTRLFWLNQLIPNGVPQGPETGSNQYYVTLAVRLPSGETYSGTLDVSSIGLYEGYIDPASEYPFDYSYNNSLETYNTETEFISRLNELVNTLPTSRFNINFIRLVSGETISANRYICITWLFGTARAQGIQILIGIANGLMYVRYSSNSNWNSFSVNNLHA